MIAPAPAFDEESRDHPNLQLIDSLQLTYPGFERDKREAEAVHSGTSKLALGFDAAIRRMKVKQRAYDDQKSMQTIHRSHPNLVSLDSLKLAYPGWEHDFQKAESAHNNNPNCDFMEVLRKMQVKQLRFENDRSHYRLLEIDNLKLSYPGWKADLRNLEKFHFEEAFFLPGDSLFQSKLDGLKRRQQIYVRSQRVRANKMRQLLHPSPEQEEEVAVDEPSAKASYAVLTSPEPDAETHPASNRASSAVQEDRSDRQPIRAPYAVILDSDTIAESARTDPPNRPDPPECDAESIKIASPLVARQSVDFDAESIKIARPLIARQSVDCEEQSERDARGGRDCDEQVRSDAEEEQEHLIDERRTDPLGYTGEEQVHELTPQEIPWTSSRLSSYIDLEPIEPEEFEEGGTSEENDNVAALPKVRFSSSVTGSRRGRSIRPKGIYSAPLMPTPDEEEKSTTSRSMASRAMSAATPSSSTRAVFNGEVSSHSSTGAMWNSEASVASASSSKAVWAESPKACYTQLSPSSIRTVMSVPESPRYRDHVQRYPVMSMPETPRERDYVQRPKSRGSTTERIRKTRCAQEKRNRRATLSEVESRLSRNSKANSKTSSQGSSRSKKLGRCAICGDPDKNHVFVPCGHLCACKNCADQVIVRKLKCPVCRGHVTEAIQVFL